MARKKVASRVVKTEKHFPNQENPPLPDMDQEPEEEVDMTPLQHFTADFAKRHREIAPFVTAKGKVRGGLKPSEIKMAKAILAEYGL